MPAGPKVSIIMAAYRAASTIGAAIASCMCQTEPDFEVIIVDDASPQSLAPAVEAEAAGDKRIRFERLGSNAGPSGARNRALELAQGEFIAILDADDSMQPDRLQRLLEAAKQYKADIVVDNMIANRIDGEAVTQALFLDPQRVDDHQTISLADYIDPASDEFFGQPLGYLKPLIRTDVIRRGAVRYDLSLTNSEDYYLIAELLALGAKMELIGYAGYNYTVQAGSISHRLVPAQTGAILEAERAFQTRHAGRLSQIAKKAGQARLRHWRNMHEFETLIDKLKQRSLLGFTAQLLRNPATMPRHLGRLSQIAWNKLSS